MRLDNNSCIQHLKRNTERIKKELPGNSPSQDDEELMDILNINSKSKFLFSNAVVETLDTIKIKDQFDCNILKSRKTQCGVIIINKEELYVFQEFHGKLKVFNYILSKKEDYADIQIFTFDLNSNLNIIGEDIEERVWKNFVRCITYLDFLPTETKFIEPGEKFGTRRSGKIINNIDEKVIYVTKAWNTEYKTQPGIKFYSSPHWGIRWTGEGRNILKVVKVKGSFKQIKKAPEKETKR